MSMTLGSGPFGDAPLGRSSPELPGEWIYVEPTPRRVRGVLGDVVVFDSTAAMVLFEARQMLRYLIPRTDVLEDALEEGTREPERSAKGEARYFHVRGGDRVAENAAWTWEGPGEAGVDLSPYFAFQWQALDHWYEEDQEVFAHARDPYHRVDAVPSSRHIRISVDGEVVAESDRAVAIFETSLPPRWYLPREDVRGELVPSVLRTVCGYKGFASYWTLVTASGTHENIAWTYRDPFHDAELARDRVCFFNEHVDIEIDGSAVERPVSPWSDPDWWRDVAEEMASF